MITKVPGGYLEVPLNTREILVPAGLWVPDPQVQVNRGNLTRGVQVGLISLKVPDLRVRVPVRVHPRSTLGEGDLLERLLLVATQRASTGWLL